MAEQSSTTDAFSLCLSGGGFRATLFHLGVVKALRSYNVEGKMALKNVKEVYAVSGGSIMAAHMLKYWDDYIGEADAFDARCAEVLAFARRDVRNRVFRRWLLTGVLGKTRGHWIQREYEWDKFLGKTTLGECYSAGPRPTFHFLATNFNSGELCSFSGEIFELIARENGTVVDVHRANADGIPLAFAVTASSAFPIAFPPVCLTPAMLGYPDDPEFAMPIELSDGGVFDNFGIEKFVYSYQKGISPTNLMVSNAGGSFRADPDASYTRILSRNMRASDVMMRRVGEASISAGMAIAGNGFSLIRIGETTDNSTINKTTQSLLRLIRTDLDRFADPVASLLVDHGEGVAGNAFSMRNWTRSEPVASKTPRPDEARANAALKYAGVSRKRTLFFDGGDKAVVLAFWLEIILATLFVWGLIGFVTNPLFNKARTEGAVTGKEDARQLIQLPLENALKAIDNEDLENAKTYIRYALALRETEERYQNIKSSVAKSGGVTVKIPQDTTDTKANIPPIPRGQIVYIQFAGSLSRGDITNLNKALIGAGWKAQGGSGERIDTANGLNEVRYSGGNSAAAQQLADAINNSGLLIGKPVTVKPLPIIGENILEVWISK